MTESEQAYDIWVDFNDVRPDGRVDTHADVAELTREITVGEKLTAGDGEGNLCPATVISVDGTRIELRLDLGRFQPEPGNAERNLL